MNSTRWLVEVALAAVGIAMTFASGADAHAVAAEAKLKDGRVTVEAFFDDNTPATDAKVVLLDETGATAAEGKTDNSGKWSIPAPAPGKYKVIVDAGAGHRASVALVIPAPTPGDSSPEVTVSQGATRDEITGPARWLWAGSGIVAIGLATGLIMFVLRRRRSTS